MVASMFLILLFLSGSMGYTLVHHTCTLCGTDLSMVVLPGNHLSDNHCCHGESGSSHDAVSPGHGDCCGDTDIGCGLSAINSDQLTDHDWQTDISYHGGLLFHDDCCTHKSRYLVTDELIAFQPKHKIVPYFLAAPLAAELAERPLPHMHSRHGHPGKPFHLSRDLTTVHCRLQT